MKIIPGKLRIVLSLLVTAAALVLMMPRSASFGYDYRKGSPWKYETLFAQFDFPLLKTQDQIDAERAESAAVVPYYRYSEDAVSRSLKAARALDLGAFGETLCSSLESIYQTGVVPDEGVRTGEGGVTSDILYIQNGKRAVKHPVSEVYRLSDARKALAASLAQYADTENVDSLLDACGIDNILVPDLIFDSQTTEAVNASSTANVSPTAGFVSAGQMIVSKDEIVTAEIEQMLDSYKKEYNANVGYDGPRVLMWIGNILLALAIATLLFLAVWLTSPSTVEGPQLWFIVMVFMIMSLMAFIVIGVDDQLLYLMPFAAGASYLRAFFKSPRSVAVYAVSLIPLLIFAHQGVVLYVIFLAGGLVMMAGADWCGKGWRQFLLVMIAFTTMALIYLGFHLTKIVSGDMLRVMIYLLASSLLVVAAYPLVYLFERMFGFVSESRLQELSDTSNSLIRLLEQKAPGTFQHSLQVMNMADAAARAIGADSLLVRCGALYHDIGKLENPQCFVENESLLNKPESEKYHSHLSPLQSASDIIRHVSDGVELAERHHLPEVIVDFIRTHHGTTRVGFFWGRHLDRGGDPALEPSFRYPGVKPKTREQIILMLCDSMEAASRTITEYTPEAYDAFVEKIVDGKMAEGQFDDADISMKELGAVKESIKAYLAQMHHGRVTYPERKIKSIFKKK